MDVGNKELLQALSKFQTEGGFVKATKENPFHKSKYAPFNEIVVKTRPVLDKNGLVINQYLGNLDGKGGVVTILTHLETMQHVTSILPLVHKDNDPQAQGSSITYAKRYGYVTILGLLVDADDDGNLAAGVGAIADKKAAAAEFYAEKAKMIKTLRSQGMTIDQVGELVSTVLEKQRVETQEDITKVLEAVEAK